MRRHDGWGRMRRPRVWFAAMPPGGPGSPSAPTTWGRLQWLDAAWMKGGESCLDTVGRMAFCPRPEARSRGQKSRDGASCGETCLSQRHVSAMCAGLLVAPHGAPSPRMCEGRQKTGLPGASTKNTGGGALAKAVWADGKAVRHRQGRCSAATPVSSLQHI